MEDDDLMIRDIECLKTRIIIKMKPSYKGLLSKIIQAEEAESLEEKDQA